VTVNDGCVSGCFLSLSIEAFHGLHLRWMPERQALLAQKLAPVPLRSCKFQPICEDVSRDGGFQNCPIFGSQLSRCSVAYYVFLTTRYKREMYENKQTVLWISRQLGTSTGGSRIVDIRVRRKRG
jgi:hypothetical protein